jgi:hypothetical protein
MKMTLRSSLIAAGFALLFASTGQASAQQAKYCAGALVANSFYSNVLEAGDGKSTVEYHGLLQNQDTQRRTMTATMVQLLKVGNYAVSKVVDRFELVAYRQRDINLLSVTANNQSGTGAPIPAQVGSTIRFVCTFK